MTAGKIIAYLAAAILIFFGVLFIWGAFSPQGQTGWIVVGLLTVGVGFAIIWFASRRKAPAAAAGESVTLNIDLPGEVSMDKLRCENCGGPLKPENIKLVAGAPVVTCPYCGTTYQLKEEPKW
jgi:hypothetical protein